MVLKFNGAESDSQCLPGGTPQGTLLGMLLFIIELSDAGMTVPSQPGGLDMVSLPIPEPSITQDEIRLKYVDDQTQGEVLYLKSALDFHSEQNGPRLFHYHQSAQ